MAAVAIGSWLAGQLAARWTVWSHATFFATLAALSLGAVAVLAMAGSKLRRALVDAMIKDAAPRVR